MKHNNFCYMVPRQSGIRHLDIFKNIISSMIVIDSISEMIDIENTPKFTVKLDPINKNRRVYQKSDFLEGVKNIQLYYDEFEISSSIIYSPEFIIEPIGSILDEFKYSKYKSHIHSQDYSQYLNIKRS